MQRRREQLAEDWNLVDKPKEKRHKNSPILKIGIACEKDKSFPCHSKEKKEKKKKTIPKKRKDMKTNTGCILAADPRAWFSIPCSIHSICFTASILLTFCIYSYIQWKLCLSVFHKGKVLIFTRPSQFWTSNS